MKESIVLLFLAWNTRKDIRRREISLESAVLLSLTGLIWAVTEKTSIWEFLLPVGVGVLFLVLSVLTAGKIGMGDAWMLIAMGTMMNLSMYITMLMLGLLAASIWSGYLMILRKMKRTTEIPFMPFLLMGYLGGLIIC